MQGKVVAKIFIILFFLSIGLSIYNFIVSFRKVTVIEKTETLINKTETLNDRITIEPFKFPLPKEYLKNVSSDQGLRDPFSEVDAGASTSGKWHNGFDIVCPDKTPVYAAKDGIVYKVYPSYYNGGKLYKGHPVYGGLIIIKHFDSTITLYGHLSFTEVLLGDEVEQGQEIGWTGGIKNRRGSGTSTGPHLHFAIYIDLNEFVTWSEGIDSKKNIDRLEVTDESNND